MLEALSVAEVESIGITELYNHFWQRSCKKLLFALAELFAGGRQLEYSHRKTGFSHPRPAI